MTFKERLSQMALGDKGKAVVIGEDGLAHDVAVDFSRPYVLSWVSSCFISIDKRSLKALIADQVTCLNCLAKRNK